MPRKSIYGAQRFITVFTRALQWPLPCAIWKCGILAGFLSLERITQHPHINSHYILQPKCVGTTSVCKCSPSSVSREVESGKCKCARMVGAREARRRGGQRCSRHVVKVNVLVGRWLDVPIALLPCCPNNWLTPLLPYDWLAPILPTEWSSVPPTKVLNKGGDLRGAQVDVPWSV